MARGPIWTDEEKSALMNLYHDNESQNFADIVNVAQRYGMFPNRSASAIKTALYRLAEEERKAMDNPAEQLELDLEERYDPELIFAQNEAKHWKERFFDLRKALLEDSFLSPDGERLYLRFTASLRWLYKNEPVIVADRIQELKEVVDVN